MKLSDRKETSRAFHSRKWLYNSSQVVSGSRNGPFSVAVSMNIVGVWPRQWSKALEKSDAKIPGQDTHKSASDLEWEWG